MKKLISTALAASIGFSSVPVSASLHSERLSFYRKGFNPNLDVKRSVDVISSVEIPWNNLETILKKICLCCRN